MNFSTYYLGFDQTVLLKDKSWPAFILVKLTKSGLGFEGNLTCAIFTGPNTIEEVLRDVQDNSLKLVSHDNLTKILLRCDEAGSFDISHRQQTKTSYIWPGTKWCGSGDVAEDPQDLGEEKETDRCCMKHDLCKEYIAGGETKYGLKNPTSYT
ncbi:phospholipase A2-like, partial [Limulus polyphemus]|uniref:Phospholipase A2-like n=1 Tax=Limulus polyphemus TaxID=6850 RepID=A0ABM1C320_LIMPO